jgi:hypothetical protein
MNNQTTEIVTPNQEQDGPKAPVSMYLSFDEDSSLFLLTFHEGERAVFQVRMTPENFEKFTADMVRTVKNYNLFMAQKYQEAQNEQSQQPKDGEQLNIGNGLLDTDDACQPAEIQPQQPSGDS